VQFTCVITADVNLCDNTHLNAIFKTGPRVTNVVLAGDLMPPAGTMLVTPELDETQIFDEVCSDTVPTQHQSNNSNVSQP